MEFVKFVSQDFNHFIGFVIVLGMVLSFVLKAIFIIKNPNGDIDIEDIE